MEGPKSFRWLVWALVLIACTILAPTSVYQSARAYWLSDDYRRAPAWLRNDPRMIVLEADAWITDPKALARHASLIQANAHRVLAIQPVGSTPLRQLAVLEQPQSAAKAYGYWKLAERVTRRDAAVQLALINAAAARGSVTEALTHYDRLLAVGSAADMLMPNLARGVGNTEIRDGLFKYADRPWMREFLTSALSQGGDAEGVVALAARIMPRMSPVDADELSGTVTHQLIARREFQAAQKHMSSLPGGAPQLLDNFAITSVTTNHRYAPLSWTWRNDDAVNANSDRQGNLDIAIAPAKSAVAAERTTLLSPGSYAITQTIRYVANTPRATLSWLVRCADGKHIWQSRLPNKPEPTTYEGGLVIPADCTAQIWRLSASADESQFESRARVSGLKLAKHSDAVARAADVD